MISISRMIQTAGFSEKSIFDPAKKEGITMIIIAAVDDRNGMMFNHRRQSQDKVLREKILSLTLASCCGWITTLPSSLMVVLLHN